MPHYAFFFHHLGILSPVVMSATEKNLDDTRGRVNSYQWKFHESTYSPLEWDTIESLQFLTSIHTLRSDYEYLLDMDDQLHTAFHFLFTHPILTKHQQRVLFLLSQSLSQVEMAKLFNCNQTSIHKALYGNLTYQIINGQKTSFLYGGIKTKLIKLVKQSFEIKSIMKEMSNYDTTGCRLPYYQSLRRHCFHSFREFEQWIQ
jgi:hypothetical protein